MCWCFSLVLLSHLLLFGIWDGYLSCGNNEHERCPSVWFLWKTSEPLEKNDVSYIASGCSELSKWYSWIWGCLTNTFYRQWCNFITGMRYSLCVVLFSCVYVCESLVTVRDVVRSVEVCSFTGFLHRCYMYVLGFTGIRLSEQFKAFVNKHAVINT